MELNSSRFCWIEGAITEFCVQGGELGRAGSPVAQVTEKRAWSDCHNPSLVLHCCTSPACPRQRRGEHPGKQWEPREGGFGS